MSEDTDNAQLLDWRVSMKPADDVDGELGPARHTEIIEDCVKEFRRLLQHHCKRGFLPVGYGPCKE